MPFKLVSAPDESVMRNDQVRSSIAFWLDERKSLSGFMASLTSEFEYRFLLCTGQIDGAGLMELTCLSLDSDLVRGIDERRRRLRLAKD
jgi:hypothetical protein